ncbi:hypothetical protein JR316_0003112 [Psilocybe cubensis]|uniref:Uncharacterized protein n=2 Tax=Psilocybe cubensis TaxID=181762 RepID=A0ACB8H7L6_PSICU|nr:hypothetical protein JR316_0003112 [Psilocybe cubensis]KAH9483642.1 hypothetical protein JR316_0003112 [Psilocybe cubensis]
MARMFLTAPAEPSSPPVLEPTNTLAVTSLPKSFFDPLILNMLRDHFASFGDINQWVPLPGFGRVIIVYEYDHHAELAKAKSDPIIIDGGFDSSQIVLRVYRADPNPLIPRGERSWIPTTSYLKPPAIEKNFLISPPGSPPVGWEQIKEDPPNATPLADDLIQALRRLQTFEEQPAFEQLLDPMDGSGVGVYVEDCDAHLTVEISEDQWVYGETAPAREKWRSFATAMPPPISSN